MVIKQKKSIYITLAIIIVLLSAYFMFFNNTDSIEPSDTGETSTINLGPPTEDESRAGDEIKVSIVDKINTPAATETRSVDVVVADATQYSDQVEVRAFVSSVAPKGSCLFIFEKEGEQITRSRAAIPDASTTTCTTLTVASNSLSVGTWSVEIIYSSDDGGYRGSTNTVVEIQ